MDLEELLPGRLPIAESLGCAAELADVRDAVHDGNLVGHATAKPISWVATIMVMPCVARSASRARTPLTSSRQPTTPNARRRRHLDGYPRDTMRVAYDRLAEGFGPGFNGPPVLAGELHRTTDRRLPHLALAEHRPGR